MVYIQWIFEIFLVRFHIELWHAVVVASSSGCAKEKVEGPSLNLIIPYFILQFLVCLLENYFYLFIGQFPAGRSARLYVLYLKAVAAHKKAVFVSWLSRTWTEQWAIRQSSHWMLINGRFISTIENLNNIFFLQDSYLALIFVLHFIKSTLHFTPPRLPLLEPWRRRPVRWTATTNTEPVW